MTQTAFFCTDAHMRSPHHFAVLRRPYGILGIKPNSDIWKASAILTAPPKSFYNLVLNLLFPSHLVSCLLFLNFKPTTLFNLSLLHTLAHNKNFPHPISYNFTNSISSHLCCLFLISWIVGLHIMNHYSTYYSTIVKHDI